MTETELLETLNEQNLDSSCSYQCERCLASCFYLQGECAVIAALAGFAVEARA